MTITLGVPDLTEMRPRITVFGVGGAGGNAVSNMIRANLEGVEFVVANTDAQALAQSACERRIQMGSSITEGLGAGSRPEIGRAAAEESLSEILDHLSGCHMVFITAGMGGGTGTGAGVVIARAAKEQGILTVGVVTKPFQFEGAHRMRVADSGIEEMQQYVDTLLVIPNQNLFRLANENTTFAAAFAMADEVLHSGVRGITDLMVMPGLINLDFADVRSVMNEMGKAMMGTGEAEGEKRALEAAEAAISNPLLDDVSMKGAKGVLINITGGLDLGLYEVDEAANRVRSEVDPDANIIVGSTFDERMEGQMRVSVVATGIDTAENVVPFSDTDGSERLKSFDLGWRRAGSGGETSSVLAMSDAIREGLAAPQPVADQPEPDIVAQTEQPPIPVAQTAPGSSDASPPRFQAGYSSKPIDDGRAVPSPGDVARAEIDDRHPEKAPAFRPADRDGSPVEDRRGADIAGQVKATLKDGMGVFERMMAGVKSARQANRANPHLRRAPVLPVIDRSQPVRSPQKPETEPPAQELATPNDSLLPVSEDEEQLEIPAFLRRQAN